MNTAEQLIGIMNEMGVCVCVCVVNWYFSVVVLRPLRVFGISLFVLSQVCKAIAILFSSDNKAFSVAAVWWQLNTMEHAANNVVPSTVTRPRSGFAVCRSACQQLTAISRITKNRTNSNET